MDKLFLVLTDEKDIKKLYLDENDYSCLKKTSTCRISPIYPVAPDNFKKPDFSNQIYIGFYSFANPSEKIAFLKKESKISIQNSLFFSHGIFSVVIFSTSIGDLKSIQKDNIEDLYAFECWKVDNHIVNVEKIWTIKPLKINHELFQIAFCYRLGDELTFILKEFHNCISEIIKRCAIYMPLHLVVFERLCVRVNVIVEELSFYKGLVDTVPASINSGDAIDLINNKIERQKRINHLVAELVQINSTISHCISQGFTGISPIFEHECRIKSYSFLGVGMAYQGITAFIRHIENVFECFPISDVIIDNYKQLPGVSVALEPKNFDSDQWDSEDKCIDPNLLDKKHKPGPLKMVHFSGRIGFRETKYAVTVPMEILELTDSPTWSMMTLSHEILHAHVAGLVSAIFKGDSNLSRKDRFSNFYEVFNNYRLPGEKQDKKEIRLIESLRNIILNYCFFKIHNPKFHTEFTRSKSKKNVEIEFEMVGDQKIWKSFSENFNEFNDIIVHVLDYHYFYRGNPSLYLGLLWESWTPVPSVLANIEYYLLRSILAISSNEAGSSFVRFENSIGIVSEILSELHNRNPENIVIDTALSKITKIEIHKKLRIEFYTGFYISEMTKKFLYSSNISGQILKDSNLDFNEDENEYIYRMNTGDFAGSVVESPIAFCQDRLLRGMQKEVDNFSNAYKAAWCLLTCSSALTSKREEEDDATKTS